MTIVYLGIAMLGGMAVSGGAAVGLERLAYRPLRKRNAPSLVFLITAIGASFVLQEFVHYILPQLTHNIATTTRQPVSSAVSTPSSRSSWCSRRSSSHSSAPRSPTSR